MDERYQRVDQDPRFRALARQRARLGWGLATLVMVAYFGFIFGIAWQPDLLARKLWAGTAFTWGLAWGLGVMFLGLLVKRRAARRMITTFQVGRGTPFPGGDGFRGPREEIEVESEVISETKKRG